MVALQARREALKPVTKTDSSQSKKSAAILKVFGFFMYDFVSDSCRSTLPHVSSICAQVNAHEKHTLTMVSEKKIVFKRIYPTKYIVMESQIYFVIIVILQKPNSFSFSMSKRLEFSQVSVLLSAPRRRSALWG